MIASKEEKVKTIERCIHKQHPEFEKYIEDTIDDMLLHNTDNKTLSAYVLADKFNMSYKDMTALMYWMCNVLKSKGYNAEIVEEHYEEDDEYTGAIETMDYDGDYYLVIKK